MSQNIQRDEYLDEALPRPVVTGPPVVQAVHAVAVSPMADQVVTTTPATLLAPVTAAVPAPVLAPVTAAVPAPVLAAAPAPVLTPVLTPTLTHTLTPASSVRTVRTSRFDPDVVVAAAVGVVLLLIGLIAIVRGGFDGPMEDPVVQVAGFNHTTTLGLIQILFGGGLLIAGATASRAGARFFGSVLAIAAFVGAVQAESFRTSLALESAHAWWLVVAGVLVVATSLLLPRYRTRQTTVSAG